MSFYYLASAYSHPDPDVRQKRYEQVRDAAAALLGQGEFVYAPILQTHDMAIHHELPTEFEFWDGFNQAMIRASRGMLILRNDGWRASRGIQAEVEFCRDIGKPIYLQNHIGKIVPTSTNFEAIMGGVDG